MADPLSIIGAVGNCYTLGKNICEFVASVKDASKERQGLLSEVKFTQLSLERLRGLLGDAENPKPLSPALQTLLEPVESLETEPNPAEEGGRRIRLHIFRDRAEHGSQSAPRWEYPGASSATTRDVVSHKESRVLSELTEVLSDLKKRLTDKGGMKEALAKGTWFWTQDGIAQDISRMVRLRGHIDSTLNFDSHDLLIDIRGTQQQEVRKTTRREVMAWLSPLDFYGRQTEIFRDSFPSADWLLESNEFKAWTVGRPWILWCYGHPGAGKVFITPFHAMAG